MSILATRRCNTRSNLDKELFKGVCDPEAIIKKDRRNKKVSSIPQVEVAPPLLLRSDSYPSNTIFNFEDLSSNFDLKFETSLFRTKSDNCLSETVLDPKSLFKPLPPVKTSKPSAARSFSFCNNLFENLEH